LKWAVGRGGLHSGAQWRACAVAVRCGHVLTSCDCATPAFTQVVEGALGAGRGPHTVVNSEGEGGREGKGDPHLAAKAALLLLLLPLPAWPGLRWRDPGAQAEWEALLDLSAHSIVAAEVGRGVVVSVSL
jgi:hypothetical protein